MTVFFFAYYGLGAAARVGQRPLAHRTTWRHCRCWSRWWAACCFSTARCSWRQHHPRLSLAMRGAALARGHRGRGVCQRADRLPHGPARQHRARAIADRARPACRGGAHAFGRPRGPVRGDRLEPVRRGHRGDGGAAARLRGEQLVDAACVRTGHVDRDGDVAACARGAPGAGAPRGSAGRSRARGAALAGVHRPADRLAEPSWPAGGARQRAAARRQRPHARPVPARSRRFQGHQRSPGPRCRRRVAQAGGAAAARTAASSRRGGQARWRRVRRDGHRLAGR